MAAPFDANLPMMGSSPCRSEKLLALLCFAASIFNQGRCAMIKKILLEVSSTQLPGKVALQIDKVILAMVQRHVLSGSEKKNERNCDSTR